MSFTDDLRRFTTKVTVTSNDVFVGVATEALRSVQEGSELTGAPGQPVDTGFLKSSWNLSFPSPTTAAIQTKTVYARVIEDGVSRYGKIQIRSAVGGSHSVALTIAGLDRIVEHVKVRVVK